MSFFRHHHKESMPAHPEDLNDYYQEAVPTLPESFPPDETIKTSDNSNVRFILRHSSSERMQLFADFSKDLKRQHFSKSPDLSSYQKAVENSMTFGEAETLRQYSGIRYRLINSVERGFWNYDELGQKTPEKEAEARETSAKISQIIEKSPRLPENIRVFRGTNLDNFRGYGVNSLEDLKKLDGQLFYEAGFTSTSLSREDSFYGREFDDTYRKKSDIEMEILVPSGSHDGVTMTNEAQSYSVNQKEYLIDKNSLFRIVGVEASSESARLIMALIPRELWDK